MEFEWDERKNRANIGKHGISFEQAVRIFEGPVLRVPDLRFDYGEPREMSVGVMEGQALITVVHTYRFGRCRIISARTASRHERKRYEQEVRQADDGR